MPELDLALHGERAEIEISVLEPELLLRVRLLVDHEGEGLAAGEDLNRVGYHLDRARVHVLVDHIGRPGADMAADRDTVLELELRRARLELRGGIGLDYHLGNAVAVPEVNEGNGAVVPLAVYPTVEYDALACVGYAEGAAGRAALLVFHGGHSTRAWTRLQA